MSSRAGEVSSGGGGTTEVAGDCPKTGGAVSRVLEACGGDRTKEGVRN